MDSGCSSRKSAAAAWSSAAAFWISAGAHWISAGPLRHLVGPGKLSAVDQGRLLRLDRLALHPRVIWVGLRGRPPGIEGNGAAAAVIGPSGSGTKRTHREHFCPRRVRFQSSGRSPALLTTLSRRVRQVGDRGRKLLHLGPVGRTRRIIRQLRRQLAERITPRRAGRTLR
jgi:hypothetical protein